MAFAQHLRSALTTTGGKIKGELDQKLWSNINSSGLLQVVMIRPNKLGNGEIEQHGLHTGQWYPQNSWFSFFPIGRQTGKTGCSYHGLGSQRSRTRVLQPGLRLSELGNGHDQR
ncbi:hypothetical protein [Synechococcus sp. M16CYN]|uniref:hypothetical protein n=1 Tax=Synechococcus sp. M16CYN TaxID=3103139 RepID=UPI003342D2B7